MKLYDYILAKMVYTLIGVGSVFLLCWTSDSHWDNSTKAVVGILFGFLTADIQLERYRK